MNNLNFYIPVELNALPEYLSSGFIGLLSSKDDSVNDKQSLAFPKNLGVQSIKEVNTSVCIEVSVHKEKCTVNDFMVETKTPTPISSITKVIFFNEKEKNNFLASYTPFKEIPIDFFLYEFVTRITDLKSIVDLNKVKVRKKKINFAPNILQSLIIAIVNSSHWLNHKISLNYEIGFPKSKLKRQGVIKFQINHFFKECNILNALDKHSFPLLDLYLDACDLLISKNERPQPNSIVITMQSMVSSYPDEANYLTKLLEKLQSIMMGMDSLPLLDDDKQSLILQRGIVLAIILNDYSSLKSYRQNQKTGTIVESIARLLYISSNKLSHIPEKLWKPSKEDFFNLLDTADDVISNNILSIKSSKEFEKDSFDAKEIISVNNKKLLESGIQPAPEIEHAINRLRSLRYTPKRASEAKISFVKTLADHSSQKIFVEPIDLKFLSQPKFKDNFKISLILKDFSKVLNTKKSRENFMTLAEKYMITFSISSESSKDLKISRHQLSSTMDKDELEQHIELISIAAREILQSN